MSDTDYLWGVEGGPRWGYDDFGKGFAFHQNQLTAGKPKKVPGLLNWPGVAGNGRIRWPETATTVQTLNWPGIDDPPEEDDS